jgi:hypothetical protein
MRALLLAIVALFVSNAALAGGDASAGKIIEFQLKGGSRFTLAFAPSDPETSMFNPQCKVVRVAGEYERLKGAWPWQSIGLTRAKHMEALSYLERAARERAIVNFGAMGSGLVAPDPAKPCELRSRALELFRDGNSVAVLSFHDRV